MKDKKDKNKKWFDIFDEFEKKFDDLLDEMSKYLDSIDVEKREREIEGPYIYGFSFIIGPDGKPEIGKFGHIRKAYSSKSGHNIRVPLTDVIERDNEFIILVELPGVDKEKIHILTKNGKIHLLASSEKRKYKKVISLPKTVDVRSLKTEYRNGILEIKVNKV
ncbi:MAG: Hsp20/alpha crystallin family protein [Nitrososphaeria archaeon]|nr:Hsp20/alpha crystallin family protein [Nitrososphaeria archaeon]